MTSLFDSHTHLQAPEFDGDRVAVLERSRRAGVAGLLVLGWDVPSSEEAIAMARSEPGVLAAAGCHPHDAGNMDGASLARLAELANDPSVAAVGEIGLDFYRDFSPRDRQIEVFERQLDTAAEVQKPVAVHCREAHERLLPLVERWSRRLNGRLSDGRPLGVMHCFSGGPELGRRYVDLGFLLSIHTSVTYPKARHTQRVARELALEALVAETDSPYGAPQSQRGKRNEPACVSEAVAAIAELRGAPVDVVAEATTQNALRLLTSRSSAPAPAQSGALRGA